MQIFTKSAEETKKFGQKFSANINHNILALSGELGSGKTTFVQGLAKGLGINTRIMSPTFILMRKHKGERYNLYHVDLYRLEGKLEGEIQNLGLKEIWEKKDNFVVIEWAEKIKDLLPKNITWITFENMDPSQRKITVVNK